ncbi:MAG: polyprenol monophosphomannose synthase [Elusimicrobiota bacterium]
MKPLIIIPTYNETENIENLVAQLSNYHLLIIDDNSPDGTGELLEKLKTANNKLAVIHRPKKMGLGTAYIQGFQWALRRDFDCIFTLDADFSHNPDYLPEFLKHLQTNDLVIGSRYVSGGGVVNWPIRRKIISRCGNLYAKNVLRYSINDSTSGFTGFRREVLEKINLDEVKSEGYGFLFEMKYRTYKLGYKIVEHPIIFVNRTLGESKISKNIIWEAIFLVWKLRLKLS